MANKELLPLYRGGTSRPSLASVLEPLNTGSSPPVSQHMGPMVLLNHSTPPPMPQLSLCRSAMQAAPNSEVSECMCECGPSMTNSCDSVKLNPLIGVWALLWKCDVTEHREIVFSLDRHPVYRNISISDHAVPPSPATRLRCSQSLHFSVRSASQSFYVLYFPLFPSFP